MAQVIQEQGLESVEKRIGVDATGVRFNSIIAVEGVRCSRNEPVGQSGRDLRHQHGHWRELRRGREEDHGLPTVTPPGAS
jgi:hypothetical protein